MGGTPKITRKFGHLSIENHGGTTVLGFLCAPSWEAGRDRFWGGHSGQHLPIELGSFHVHRSQGGGQTNQHLVVLQFR